jgi:hypothetical protein
MRIFAGIVVSRSTTYHRMIVAIVGLEGRSLFRGNQTREVSWGMLSITNTTACRSSSEVSNFDHTAISKERMQVFGCRAREGAHVENRSILAIR